MEIEDLDLIDSIAIETAVVDIKGKLTIEFEDFNFTNRTTDRRRLFQDEDILSLELSIDEEKNGLDPDVVKFSYDIEKFDDK